MKKKRQKKILFYSHDGAGFGHLSRLCKMAEWLQGDFSCLVVGGHRSMSHLVPKSCEYIHLPNFDSFCPVKSALQGREAFVKKIHHLEIVEFRKNLMNSIVKEFWPDVIFVDFFPLGKYNEIEEIIAKFKCVKYFILRGVIGEDISSIELSTVLNAKNQDILTNYFKKVLITIDERILNIGEMYNFNQVLTEKTLYTGYVSIPVQAHTIEMVRQQRGLKENDRWVVCSSGSGIHGANLIKECQRIAELLPNIHFDIIRGEQNTEFWGAGAYDFKISGNLIYQNDTKYLSLLHASADIVICHGGYNSLVECMEGNTYIIAAPNTKEQFTNVELLQKYHKILCVENYDDLLNKVSFALNDLENTKNAKTSLNFDGLINIEKQLISDTKYK